MVLVGGAAFYVRNHDSPEKGYTAPERKRFVVKNFHFGDIFSKQRQKLAQNAIAWAVVIIVLGKGRQC